MHVAESLLAYSLENFLHDAEIESVLRAVELVKQSSTRSWDVRWSGRTVHAIDGVGREETVAVYEPKGRVEIDQVPQAVSEIMNAALTRRMRDIQRAFPSARTCGSWIYLEYHEGQFITSHIDLAVNEETPGRKKIAGLSVHLNEDFEGGELYMETCGAERLWRLSEEGWTIGEGSDNHTPWFRELPRTRWVSQPQKGSALFHGSQLIHGTLPVMRGVVKKVIGFITE